jgi:hypothetical protein
LGKLGGVANQNKKSDIKAHPYVAIFIKKKKKKKKKLLIRSLIAEHFA